MVKMRSAEVGAAPRMQVGVLPVARLPGGDPHVYLVTSRETRRWVIPKGWPMKGLKAHEAGAREAYEEAGLLGRVGKRALGQFAYDKRLKGDRVITCLVQVFPLAVRKQVKNWPEKSQRVGRWFTIAEAARVVSEPGLAAIIRALANTEPEDAASVMDEVSSAL
jgi:8-oxo-dGTP pyrophosphatase MutT (NUDIX family)